MLRRLALTAALAFGMGRFFFPASADADTNSMTYNICGGSNCNNGSQVVAADAASYSSWTQSYWVAMQEVCARLTAQSTATQWEYLWVQMANLGYQGRDYFETDANNSPCGRHGNAMFAKPPGTMYVKGYYTQPADDSGNRRGVVCIRATTAIGCSTHLSNSPSSYRQPQSQQYFTIASDYDANGFKVNMAGDFNSVPGSGPIGIWAYGYTDGDSPQTDATHEGGTKVDWHFFRNGDYSVIAKNDPGQNIIYGPNSDHWALVSTYK